MEETSTSGLWANNLVMLEGGGCTVEDTSWKECLSGDILLEHYSNQAFAL